MRTRVAVHAVAFLTLITATNASAAKEDTKSPSPLPRGASEVIKRVSVAARKKDFKALRAEMIQEFTWSFGGDRDADQAVEEWKREPRYLRELTRVLGTCHASTSVSIECLGRGSLDLRAGFIVTDGKWRMNCFVGGD